MLSRYAIVAIPGPTVIWHVSSLPGAAVSLHSMRRAGACRAGGASTGPRANTGSDDRSCDLAADRGGALYQTPWPDDRSAGRQRRCAQGGVGGVQRDAASGDAVSGPASRRNAGEARCLADRCTRVWDLRDAAFCEDDTPGPGGCSGTLCRNLGATSRPKVRSTN
jgi:hypothetical protein